MHPLLVRQLRKIGLASTERGPELERLLAAIDDAYVAADDDRTRLERSLQLTSDELFERNRRLESELAQRKRLESELQHAEKLRAVGLLAAGVAHEINTPVQYLGDSVRFLTDAFGELELAYDDEARRRDEETAFLRREVPNALARCTDGVARVSRIVHALKMLAHPDDVEQHPADVADAIRNTLVVCASEVKHVAEVRLELESQRPVRCHIGEIQQVLLNLLVNAGHAVAERVAGSDERGTIVIATRDEDADVVISIRDDGPGIPPEIRDRIFEPFFTTKPIGKGTGQGLSIAHSLIVEHHRGQIAFDSTVGVGTTFTIRLPADGRPTSSAPA
jgi:signal transduction histidine kinase